MLPDLRKLRERPELVALAGVLLALVAVGLARYGLAIAGAAVACAGFGLYAATTLRAQRLSAAVREALGAQEVFDALVGVLERNAGASWIGLVAWGEHGLGGSVTRESGTERPDEASLVSWLVRDAESGNKLVIAPELEFGRAGVLLAMPLRRENSALVAFLVLAMPRGLPAHVELALGTTLDEVALALADRPLHARADEPVSERKPTAVV
jgi:hypothetical protein